MGLLPEGITLSGDCDIVTLFFQWYCDDIEEDTIFSLTKQSDFSNTKILGCLVFTRDGEVIHFFELENTTPLYVYLTGEMVYNFQYYGNYFHFVFIPEI